MTEFEVKECMASALDGLDLVIESLNDISTSRLHDGLVRLMARIQSNYDELMIEYERRD